MIFVFTAFTTYDQARDAVAELYEEVDADAVNALVQSTIADSHLADVEKPDGLDALIEGQQPVATDDVGSIYAAGDAATVVADSASRSRGEKNGLAGALADFSFDSKVRDQFVSAVQDGGVLLWVKVDDDKSGQVGQVFRKYDGISVVGTGG